jgi:hypothetical protein
MPDSDILVSAIAKHSKTVLIDFILEDSASIALGRYYGLYYRRLLRDSCVGLKTKVSVAVKVRAATANCGKRLKYKRRNVSIGCN